MTKTTQSQARLLRDLQEKFAYHSRRMARALRELEKAELLHRAKGS